ncbi:MAG: alpha/beta hydrolase family protein [Planctomycetales bacterium]
MFRALWLSVLSLPLLFSGLATALEAPAASKLEGIWEGKLKVNAGLELRLALKVTRQKDGSLKGTLDSIDQGAKDMPLDNVSLTEREVAWGFERAKIAYAGKLNDAGTIIDGTFTQGPAKFPLVLKRVEQVSVLDRPQEPKPPFPYQVEEVTYDNAQAQIKLAGTLTIPQGAGPFPAVVLISGSGPQDRDEQLLGHRPFLVLADHLTRQGIAVLRFDDRGVGKSTGTFGTATSADFLEDVLAGVAFLKTRSQIDSKKIGLAGHSEGGLIAPMAAVRSSDVAFIVLLAGPGTTGAEVLTAQGRLIAQRMGAAPNVLDWNEAVQKRAIEAARAEPDNAQAKVKIRAALQEEFARLHPDFQKLLIATQPAGAEDAAKPDSADKAKTAQERYLDTVASSTDSLLTPWFRYFIDYDPRPTLAQVKCPVLALIGEKDLQVPSQENLSELTRALANAGNRDLTLRELPGLNHLFQTCQSGLPSEYAQISETMSPVMLELVARWINERFK